MTPNPPFDPEPRRATLEALARFHVTDKLEHGYVPFYELYLSHMRDRPVRLLEIGVGGYADAHEGGASLRMWRDYFPAGRIVGLDTHEKMLDLGDRVTLVRGQQQDPEVLDRLDREHGPFDVVVDDGSHVNPHRNFTFMHLFPRLAPRGIYVMEDLQTSYWPRRFRGHATDTSSPDSSIGLLKSLIDGLQYPYIPSREEGALDRQITGICFHPKMAFVHKGVNVHELSLLEAAEVEKQGQG